MLGTAQRRAHRCHDLLRHVALNRERIVQRAVVSLRPDLRVRRRVNQLHVDAQAPSFYLHAPLHHAPHPQLARNLPQGGLAAFVAYHRRSADYLERRHLGQFGQKLLVQPAREVGMRSLGAQVLKRQHGDRRALVRQRGGHRLSAEAEH